MSGSSCTEMDPIKELRISAVLGKKYDKHINFTIKMSGNKVQGEFLCTKSLGVLEDLAYTE
jgi:hypothetical protein